MSQAPSASNPRVLVAWIDGVLRPSDAFPNDRRSLMGLVEQRFSEPWQLVYLTDRSQQRLCEAIAHDPLPLPDWVICDHGTSLYRAEDPFRLVAEDRWQEHLARSFEPIDWAPIVDRLTTLAGVRQMELDYHAPLKRSFGIDPAHAEAALPVVQQQVQEMPLELRVDATVTDEEEHVRFDLLPATADPWNLFDTWRQEQQLAPEQCVLAVDAERVPAGLEAYKRIMIARHFRPPLQPAERDPDVYHAAQPTASGVLEGWQFFCDQAGTMGTESDA